MSADALVIGGGLVGLSCALNLQLQGIPTTLVDPATTRRGASWGNAGHLATEQAEPLASRKTVRSFPRRLYYRGGALSQPARDIDVWLPFALRLIRGAAPAGFEAGTAALRSLLRYAIPAWRHLAGTAGAGHLLAEDGHFVVWESERGATAGRAAWQSTDTGTATFRDATAEEVAALSARMSRPIAGAIRFSGTGHILDLGELADCLNKHFIDTGGTQRTARAQRIVVDSSRAAAMLDGGEVLRADVIVLAAGVASAALLQPLGYRVPMIAERGYHIQSTGADWPAGLPPLVFEERSMIVTPFRSGLRAASFVEFARADSPADPRKWARLRRHVVELGLPFREV